MRSENAIFVGKAKGYPILHSLPAGALFHIRVCCAADNPVLLTKLILARAAHIPVLTSVGWQLGRGKTRVM